MNPEAAQRVWARISIRLSNKATSEQGYAGLAANVPLPTNGWAIASRHNLR